MIRLTFKTEFREGILDGTKRFTARWKLPPGIREGVTVSAVCRVGTTPAFLVPADQGFATLKIVSVRSMAWRKFKAERCFELTTVTEDWYLRERPLAGDSDTIHLIEFKVIRP